MKSINLIAETAWHHDGDYQFLKRLVNRICTETKADFVKCHITIDVDEYMHYDHSAYNWAKDRIFSKEEWEEIIQLILDNQKKIMLLLNDKKAIDFAKKYNPELVEIHSVCLNDIHLLRYLKENVSEETKVVLGVGGSTLYEIENAINILGKKNIVLMHGFQNYPTRYEDVNFARIKKIIQLFPYFQHGYADHTAWNNENNLLITLMGAALGMDYIEKHVTIAYGEERVDWNAAISIEMFNELSEKLDVLEKAYGNGFLSLNNGERQYSVFGPMKKAAILSRDVDEGEFINENDICFKRTSQLSDLSQIDVLEAIGNRYKKRLSRGHCLIKEDIEY